MEVFGRPAAHASRLAAAARRRIILAHSAPLLPILLLLLAGPDVLLASALIACGLLVPYLLTGADRTRLAKASAGVRAERRVAASLAAARPAALVHGFRPAGRGDVDHVVLGPCLAAVETKHGRGRVEVGRDGRLRASGRVMHGDPVGQAAQAASLVSRVLSRPTAALLVVSGMTNRPFAAGEVTVCGPGDAATVLAGLPRLLSQQDALRTARRLQELSAEG